MKRSICGAAIIAVCLSGCVGGAIQNAQWRRTDLQGGASDRQKTIDVGYCRQASAGSVPMPSFPAPNQPSGYQISGTYGQTGKMPSTFQAAARPVQSPIGSFSGGLAQGMAMRQSMDARSDRADIFDGCMTALGWDR